MKRRYLIKYLSAATIAMVTSSCRSKINQSFKHNPDICKVAWGKIANKGRAFNYVNPEKRLPNVLIYGDSISIGYTPAVQQALAHQAAVFRIHRNGGSSRMFIDNMETMRKAMFQPFLDQGWNFEWDMIHFNVGLHDLKYLKDGELDKEDGVQVSSIATYKSNLVKLCDYLNTEYPNTKLIFATTTPVPEGDVKGRIQGDSLRYNTAAKDVLKAYPEIAMNDLYSFTFPHVQEWQRKPADVHYNKLGVTQQGKEVARVITKYLK